ncbi:MAG TPA: acyl-CoA synthetase [Dongiaceae bacterium]|jgi:fatty-acyl-CoA synthase|nr:acyl-CoA synthetase [Dongiaceae bacterium]
MPSNIYRQHLERNRANYAPLTPLSFLERSALAYPEKTAIIHGDQRFTYAKFRERCHRLASALNRRGIGAGDTVAVMAPNVPAMLEAHFGIPMSGAVLNALNTRLDAATIAFCLAHGEAKLLIADREYADVIEPAVRQLGHPLTVIDIDDPLAGGAGRRLGEMDYEAFIAEGDPEFRPATLADEWAGISLGYTSGTTGNPKGVVCHHRGAYLAALGVAMSAGLSRQSIYLWTLPMFHCNGWCFTWAVTAAAGTHICLRRMDPAQVYATIKREGVTHICGAPVVLNMLANAPDSAKQVFERRVSVTTGGAAPPSAVIAAMERNGFHVTHAYGLTECYGPGLICAWHDEWDALSLEERARLTARQGVNYPTLEGTMVADPSTLAETPWDGEAMGEIFLRGNTVMMGYLKNPSATDAAFEGGWFHTGDLAVRHPDGYIEVKDRSKDVIISGGENISSLEVEEVLYRHPKVLEAAVVARPDEKWGEHPCAFVTTRADAGDLTPEEVIDFCRANMAHFKTPRTVVFGPLPKTSTGKIQKYLLRERAKALPAAE